MADYPVTDNANLLLHSNPANPAQTLSVSRTDADASVPLAQVSMFGGGAGSIQGILSFRTLMSGSLGERLRVHTNGSVGIGVTAPVEKLEVNGTVKATAFNGDGLNLSNLDGGQILNGTIPDARVALTIARTADVEGRFNPASGHDHDGMNSKRILAIDAAHFADLSGANLTGLNGSQITTGTVPEARIDAAIARDSEVSAKFDATSGHDHDGTDSKRISSLSSTYFADLSGANLTNLNGSQITSGTVPEARIDAAIARDSEVNAKFDATSGHDHDGTNSKKISPTNLLNVSPTVTAGNLNIITAGSSSDASAQHYHATIPQRYYWYCVPMKALPVGFVWYSQLNSDYAYDPPVFDNNESRLLANPNVRSAAFIPLYLPNYASLSQMTINASVWNGTPEVQVTLLRGNAAIAMASITSTGTKTVSFVTTIDNANYEYMLRVVIVKASTDYVAINSIKINYSTNRLF